jgi:hypothetical protein
VGCPLWLENGFVVYNCCWTSPEQLPRSKFCRTHDHILVSQIWDSHNLVGQIPAFIFPRKRIAQVCPQAVGLSNHSKSKSSYNQRSVGQFVLVSGHHLRPMTKFSFSSMEIIFRYLRCFCYGASSPTRGWVCILQFLDLANAVFLGFESHGTHDNLLLSQS